MNLNQLGTAWTGIEKDPQPTFYCVKCDARFGAKILPVYTIMYEENYIQSIKRSGRIKV